MYLAAKALLASSKLPIKMAGITLAAALYAAEGDGAKEGLGMEDMEHRIKAQVSSGISYFVDFFGWLRVRGLLVW